MMDSTPTTMSTKTARYRGRWFFIPALLVAVGAVMLACSDNSGPAGPHFSNGQAVPTTGQADTAAQIIIRVVANPASTEPGRRVGITVLVTNLNGAPLAGRRVVVNSTVNSANAKGAIDQAIGTTDSNGIYQTTLLVRCVDAGVTGNTINTGGGAAPVLPVSQRPSSSRWMPLSTVPRPQPTRSEAWVQLSSI
jgi:hypothetical protein